MSLGGDSESNKGGWSSSPPNEAEEESYERLLYSISTHAMLSSTPDIKQFIFSTPSENDNRSVVSNESGGSPVNSSSTSKGLSIFKRKKSFTPSSGIAEASGTSVGTSGTPNAGNDFEIIPKTVVLNSQEPETQEFLLHLTTIANHVGLDEQDYKCASCGRPIGMIYGKFRVCEFDGFNYCTECHIDERWTIPARIVNNWDFKKYPVANRNKKRLQLIESEPLIDIKVSASILYKVVKELREILDLRTQLFYLHAYLFTCKEEHATNLRRILWPRDHLYEHIHLYSTVDLLQIQSGATLSSLLRKAIHFARKHVLSCVLCSQKGFICEICKSNQIIYPFDTKITYRCDNCKAVFHISCFITETGKRPCPRCLRINRRENAAVITRRQSKS
ncbi:pleckstrin homology domain-containing family M member 3 [Tetranychus urticae]|uniref:Rubicon Homology domain-containing protein n=1 Tax=Tetranychus urticae TaxID=32264 RepID=T1L198_TETUR|nr:pleckstrin homology domain-containing family M member 3 [Tetranychus urticae]